MKRRQTVWMAVMLTATLVALTLPVWAETTNHSGTIAAVDTTTGTIVLSEIGPWRVQGGTTEITRRTIALASTTEFKLVKRTPDAGPTGWVGDFVEVELSARDLKEGDFVTVTVERKGQRLTALKVKVVAPEES